MINKHNWTEENEIICNVLSDGNVEFYQQGKKIKIYKNVNKHKYGNDHINMIVSVKDLKLNKTFVFSVAKLCYLCNVGDIPKKHDVHHKDGNSLNNEPKNLETITRSENLKKRKLTWSEIYKNYHEKMGKEIKE